MTLRYRADIDGLRAVAVLAVLFFHADWGLPGGFVGVDVFFVISGYLITSLLCEDLDRGRFGLLQFWERRIRRIWPAAFAVTLSVLAVGWMVLLPLDFMATAGDAVAQTAMLANVRFVRHVIDGYFAESSDLRPLLHMWSLAVEEQFYLVMPLVLARCWHWGRRWVIGVLWCAAVGSFVASQCLLRGHSSDVFFLTPFRAWELLAGALLAFSPMPRTGRFASVVSWVGMTGMAMVLVPIFAYSRATPFPGLYALAPCLGTVLVIAAGADPDRVPITSRLLGSSVPTAIGRISYSLYLWHWPVFAFLRYCLGRHLSLAVTAVALVFVFALSFVSWRFVEEPFRRLGKTRHRDGASIAATLLPAVAVAIAIVGLSLGIHRGRGMPTRFTPDQLRFAESCTYSSEAGRFVHEWPLAMNAGLRFPPIGAVATAEPAVDRPAFLLWGDSHAMCIVTTIDEISRRLGVRGAAAILPATVPLPDVWWPASRWGAIGPIASRTWSHGVIEWIRQHRPRHVILCAAWSSYVPPTGGGGVESIRDHDRHPASPADALRHGLKSLKDECGLVGATLWILEDVPFQSVAGRERVVVAHLRGGEIDVRGVDRENHERQQAAAADVIRSFSDDRVRVVDLAAPFFDVNGVSRTGSGDQSWYVDGSHVTAWAADRVLGDVLGGVLVEVSTGAGPDGAAVRER